MSPTNAELPTYGGSLALSFLSLGLVCLLAWLLVRWLGRKGVGRGVGPLRVIARCPLEPRRSVYLVEAGQRCFLLGVGDGPMALLAELEPSSLAADDEMQTSAPLRTGARFKETLVRVMGRP